MILLLLIFSTHYEDTHYEDTHYEDTLDEEPSSEVEQVTEFCINLVDSCYSYPSENIQIENIKEEEDEHKQIFDACVLPELRKKWIEINLNIKGLDPSTVLECLNVMRLYWIY